MTVELLKIAVRVEIFTSATDRWTTIESDRSANWTTLFKALTNQDLGDFFPAKIRLIPLGQLTNWHDGIARPLENFNIGKKAYHDDAICGEPQARSTRTGLRSGVNGVRVPRRRLNTAIDLLHCWL